MRRGRRCLEVGEDLNEMASTLARAIDGRTQDPFYYSLDVITQTNVLRQMHSLNCHHFFLSQIGCLSASWQVDVTSACDVLLLLDGCSDSVEDNIVVFIPGRSSSPATITRTVAVSRHPHWLEVLIDRLRIAGLVQLLSRQDDIRTYPTPSITNTSLSSCSIGCSS